MDACRSFLPLVFCIGSVFGQPPDPSLRFTSVTIKGASSDGPAFVQGFFGRAPWWSGRCGDSGSKRSESVPDSLVSNCTLTFANLLGHAYHLNAAQFNPDPWMDSTWFKIQAKAPPGATEDQFRIMEQNLLADRFKLSAHFEKREVAAYGMLVGRRGPNFLPAGPGPHLPGFRGLGTGFGPNGRSVFLDEAVSMDQLAAYISYFLNSPVVDATELRGFYQINLKFGAMFGRIPALDGPPLAETVRDQLGLILERTKTVMDVLVIDHVEKKPTPQ